ncbi:MAG: energy-coupling factor transporter ATPase [Eubacteriales bacterium]|nr:energy-coupling factor transporter ATPase [Eubacteriales bacterium]
MSIQVRNLSYVYNEGMPDEQTALDNINFSIYDGEIAAVIGHTGSGKSTLVQHLNGLLKPKEGTILVGGVDITRKNVSMRDIRCRVGLVFQYPEYQLFEETVEKDVAFGPKNLGLSDAEIQVRVQEALELVGLDYRRIGQRSPFDLSGGQKRRVAIAGVIAMKPQVLILDEPTAGLDPGAHRDIMRMIRDIHEAENNIIIFVTHNMNDVVELSDKVLVLSSGKLVTVGSPREVFSQGFELSSVGLDVPPARQIVSALKERGENVRSDVLTIDEAEREIERVLQKKQEMRKA